MRNQPRYNEEIEKIRQELVKEVKKSLPAAYNIQKSNEAWAVFVGANEEVLPQEAAQSSGFYIGGSIDSLSLSDLALLIDGFPKGCK